MHDFAPFKAFQLYCRKKYRILNLKDVEECSWCRDRRVWVRSRLSYGSVQQPRRRDTAREMLLCIVIFGRQRPCQYAWALSRVREPVTQGMLHTDDNNQAQVLEHVLRLSSFTVVTLREGKLLGRKGQAALVVQPFFQPAFPLFCILVHNWFFKTGKSENPVLQQLQQTWKLILLILNIMMSPWESNLAHDHSGNALSLQHVGIGLFW